MYTPWKDRILLEVHIFISTNRNKIASGISFVKYVYSWYYAILFYSCLWKEILKVYSVNSWENLWNEEN